MTIKSSGELYLSIYYFANKLGVQVRVLLAALDSVVIVVDKKRSSGTKMTHKIDIGLNFVRISRNLIVPGFVRIGSANQDAFGWERYKQFDDLEINNSYGEFIVDYFQKIRNTQLVPLIQKAVQLREKVIFDVRFRFF